MKIVISTDSAQPNARYRGALLCAGALPEEVVLVTPADPVPEDFDGLLIAGGSDVDPSRYGEAPATPTLEVDAARDTLDFALFAASQRKKAPVFGICRGLQLVNVALGGTLWQDLASERDRGLNHDYDRGQFSPDHPAHPVRTPGRRGDDSPVAAVLAEVEDELLNSRHHQAVKDLAAGLRPLAASPDDLVEAFERPGGSYLAAVQWHPEDLVARPAQKNLFRTFLDACRAHARENGRAGGPLVEVSLEGLIPVVKLTRPAKRNAFAGGMRELLGGTIEALGGDPTVPAIVLTGAGNAFSAGGDIEVMRALAEARDVDGFRQLLESGARAVLAIVKAPRPVLAAVDGPAAGAGMSLALACDVRVASAFEKHEAVFSPAFAAVGLSPDWGGTFHLPLLAGPSAAADLAFSGDPITARRAFELGLVDLLAEDGPSLPVALARAARYAENSAAALAATKKNLNAERLPRLVDALARERDAQIELFRSGEVTRRLPARGSRRPARQETS